jgi:hypothetical protein
MEEKLLLATALRARKQLALSMLRVTNGYMVLKVDTGVFYRLTAHEKTLKT